MYTQCNHCNAIFRVTMKELTAAQGLLRCGECDTIFDAMKTLSPTLPEERRFAPLGVATPAPLPLPSEEESSTKFSLPRFNWRFLSGKQKSLPRKAKISTSSQSTHSPSSSRNFLYIGIVALSLLLLLQLLYTSRDWLAQQPITSAFAHQACAILGCDITIPRDIRKINLLSRNVYSHPNTPNVLTVSASIQNDAAFPQIYPLIEISFLDKQDKVLALRRFPPTEYIHEYAGQLMPVGVPKELLLNISDPGDEAVRFRFRFM